MSKDIYRALTDMLCERGLMFSALPLGECKIVKPYLLDRAGISNGTVFIMAAPYLSKDALECDCRNVSLYAAARDYHIFYENIAKEILPMLKSFFPDNDFAMFSDHSPIIEADAAARSGLGLIGHNGLFITKKYGSFVFLGEIITDAPYFDCVPKDMQHYISQDDDLPNCKMCTKCSFHCPMGSCSKDKKSCLSALTQKKGELDSDEKKLLSNHPLVWGCDTCQLICPINQEVIKNQSFSEIPFFCTDLILKLDEEKITSMADKDFSSRAYSWRGRETVCRNIKIHSDGDKTCSN